MNPAAQRSVRCAPVQINTQRHLQQTQRRPNSQAVSAEPDATFVRFRHTEKRGKSCQDEIRDEFKETKKTSCLLLHSVLKVSSSMSNYVHGEKSSNYFRNIHRDWTTCYLLLHEFQLFVPFSDFYFKINVQLLIFSPSWFMFWADFQECVEELRLWAGFSGCSWEPCSHDVPFDRVKRSPLRIYHLQTFTSRNMTEAWLEQRSSSHRVMGKSIYPLNRVRK